MYQMTEEEHLQSHLYTLQDGAVSVAGCFQPLAPVFSLLSSLGSLGLHPSKPSVLVGPQRAHCSGRPGIWM